jgi:hypothetical protein
MEEEEITGNKIFVRSNGTRTILFLDQSSATDFDRIRQRFNDGMEFDDALAIFSRRLFNKEHAESPKLNFV